MCTWIAACMCASTPSFWVFVTPTATWPNLIKLREGNDVSSLVASSDLTNCSFDGGLVLGLGFCFFVWVWVFLIYNVQNRNVQIATEDRHISELPGETSSNRERSTWNRAFPGWKKAQTLRTAPTGREKEEKREAGSLSWHICPGRMGARLGDQRCFPFLLSCMELLW